VFWYVGLLVVGSYGYSWLCEVLVGLIVVGCICCLCCLVVVFLVVYGFEFE